MRFHCRYAVQLLTPAHFLAKINGMLNILLDFIGESKFLHENSPRASIKYLYRTTVMISTVFSKLDTYGVPV